MAFKLFISDYTYRTREQQIATFGKVPELNGSSIFSQDDLSVLFRPSTRQSSDTLVAASSACFAKTEEAFKDLLDGARKKNLCLEGLEDGFVWRPGQSTAGAVKAWKTSRMLGVARIGGQISAKLREAETLKGIELIRGDWPKPSREVSTKELKERSGLSLNTIKKHLGARPIAQYNYQAKLKRKANAKR